METYLSQNLSISFPSFEEWRKGLLPPSPYSIFFLFVCAKESPLTSYGYSNIRYKREIQSVSVPPGETMSLDWTFQTLKNYSNVTWAKAIVTAMAGTSKEILTLDIVPSTAVKDMSYMLLKMVKKCDNFYQTICPKKSTFFQDNFQSNMNHRLGLIHLLHCMFDTLDSRCYLYCKECMAMMAMMMPLSSNV